MKDPNIQMQYNSQKEDLAMSEYGRNVQMLVNHAKTIEDPEHRLVFVEKIIDLMQQMHPQTKNIDDHRSRLWKHIFRIANFELDVDPPEGERPTAVEAFKRPEKLTYPHNETRFRHYGNNVQLLVKKAVLMEEGPKRDSFVAIIGSYMKLAYRTWNKDYFASDEIIKRDLETLSEGKLVLGDHIILDSFVSKKRNSSNSSSHKKHYSSNRSSSNSNYRKKNSSNNNRRRR